MKVRPYSEKAPEKTMGQSNSEVSYASYAGYSGTGNLAFKFCPKFEQWQVRYSSWWGAEFALITSVITF